MPGLIVSIGGKLDKSYSSALDQAATMARQQQRQLDNIRTIAPGQLDIVNRALAKLPAESLMRPRLEAMKATLTEAMGTAGGQAGGSFLSKFMERMKGHGTGGMAQLIHVVRASFDSIISGIPIWRVAAMQGPQALQAFTMMGKNSAMAFIAGIAAYVATAGAIIAAPFLYLWRVSSIAKHLSETPMLDIKTDYLARANTLANAYRDIARAIRDTAAAYNSATAAAERNQKVISSIADTQKQLDAAAKEREIAKAFGNQIQIAQIEKKYAQLEIQRENERLLSEKQNKEAERAGLEREIAQKKREIAGITVEGGPKHDALMADLKKQYEADLQTVKPQDRGWWSTQWNYLRASVQSGGFIAGMANPQGGNNLTKEQLNLEAKARQDDIDKAQIRIRKYQELVQNEDRRNQLIEDRKKLTTEAEQKSKRYQELTSQIADADAERLRLVSQMQQVAAAKAENTDWQAQFGGNSSANLTANQRQGAFAYSQSVTLVDLTRKSEGHLAAIKADIAEIKNKPGGIPGFN